MRTLDPTLRGGLLDSPAPSAGRPNPLGGLLGDMNRLQKASLATTLLPVIPDVLGAAGDLQMYAQKPETRTPLNYGLSALGLLPFIGGATAFHGSPHVFDKFDMTKIGTGEGAQAYGHGLYFAESPEVAERYRKDISSMISSGANRSLAQTGNNIDEAIALANEQIKRLQSLPNQGGDPERLARQIQIQKDKIEFLNSQKAGIEAKGAFYTVDIPDEAIDQMLDWDKPFKDQPKAVKDILGEKIDAKIPAWKDFPEYTGKKFYNEVAGYNLGKFKEASARLREAGIPGIKYFDQGSRAAGDGTRNYVVFDDALPKIMKREQ